MNTKSFALKSLIALGAFAVLSTNAVAGPRAWGHVKPFDGRTGMAPVARANGHVKVFDGARGQAAMTPASMPKAKLWVRKTGSDKSQD